MRHKKYKKNFDFNSSYDGFNSKNKLENRDIYQDYKKILEIDEPNTKSLKTNNKNSNHSKNKSTKKIK